MTTLNPQHFEMLTVDSAISNAVIEQRGYFSETDPKKLVELGFSPRQSSVASEKYPVLVIPYWKTNGENGIYCMRPDCPRSIDQKKKKKLEDGTYPQQVFKYELPRGSGNMLDCHPQIIPYLGDPDKMLIFTEGCKKADSLISKGFLAININGVYGFRGTNGHQGKTTLPDFEDVALNNRHVVLLFDSDIRDNVNVQSALRRLKAFLKGRGAKVTVVLLPPNGSEKTGIDDFFASGKTALDLDDLIAYFQILPADLGGQRVKWTIEKYADLFREWGYRFRMNDMVEDIELNGKLFDDTLIAIVEGNLYDERIPIKHAHRAIITLGNSDRYHPIKEHLDSLRWDGKDHIKVLATHFADKHGVFPIWFKKWLVGSVAKIFGDGKHQNFMLVLGGEQDLGKSHFVKWLCPLPDYFLESAINPDDKDSFIRLISNWVWEVGELGSVTRRADREALKHFITTGMIDVRKHYNRKDTIKPSLASLVGTINIEGSGFLDDPTGNRRYCVAELTRIDWDYSQNIDVNQVWAQAKYIYDNRGGDKPWVLNDPERETRDQINEAYEVQDPIQDMIIETFDFIGDKMDKYNYCLSTPAILGILDLSKGNKTLAKRVATILKTFGLEQEQNPRHTPEGRKRRWIGISEKIIVEVGDKKETIDLNDFNEGRI